MKEGDYVRVKPGRLLATDRAFGTALPMEDMKGKVFKVEDETVCGLGVMLAHPVTKLQYSFHKYNCELIEEKITEPIKAFGVGDIVIVSDKLTRSFKKYGKALTMNDMKGQSFKIIHELSDEEGVILESKTGDTNFTFSKMDLISPRVKKKKIKKETFDPEMLVIS